VEAEKREEDKLAKRMQIQRIEAAKLMDRAGVRVNVEASNMDRSEGDAPIALKLGSSKVATLVNKSKKKAAIVFDDDDDDDDEAEKETQTKPFGKDVNIMLEGKAPLKTQKVEDRKRKSDGIGKREDDPTSAQPVLREESHKKQRHEDRIHELEDVRKKNWIRKDILVRIISKKFAKGKYYKRKAIINRVYDKFTAEVEILDSGPDERDGGDIVEVDQNDLETVVPNEGKKVMILNGRGRGMMATLLSADNEKCRGKLELLDDGTILKKVDFDDFSKAA